MEQAPEIRVGVVGAGRGGALAEVFNTLPEARVVAVADRFPARLQDVVRACPGARGYESYEQMLAEGGLDAVVVASDAPAHPAHTLLALEAGVHVLSEVPVGLTLAGHLQVLTAAQRSPRLYALGENCVHWGFVGTWKEMVARGELGEISYAEAEYLHDMPDGHFVDAEGRRRSHDDARSDPTMRRNWRARFHPIQYLTHSLGPLLWITDDRCISVSCMATPAHRDPECGSPDLESATFYTAAGRVFRIACGFNIAHPIGHWFRVVGSKSTVTWAQSNLEGPRQWRQGDNPREWTQTSWPRELPTAPPEAQALGHWGADWVVARTFADAVLHGAPPPVGVHRAMDFSLPGVCAAISAERGGELIAIPDTRNADELRAWLAHGYDEPWPYGPSDRVGW